MNLEELKEDTDKSLHVIYKSVTDIEDLLFEMRRQMSEILKQKQETGDLPIYNLKDGLGVNLPHINWEIPGKDKQEAKERMNTYREFQLSRMKDMASFAEELQRERSEINNQSSQ